MGRPGNTNLVRLNKFIADSGFASRRKADELIEEGHVIVNGKKVFELGIKVDPQNDRITVQGKTLKPVDEKVYVIFNKPKNVVTSMNDPEGRPSVADYFADSPIRLFPVGRLDWDSEGLLLLTNDGEYAQSVAHPAQEVTKTYLVKVDGKPTDEKIKKLLQGVSIVGGRVQAKHIEKFRRGGGEKDWFRIVITEGKNRQIRKMFEKIGCDVLKLQRIAIGQLDIGTLERGQFKAITPERAQKVFKPDFKMAPKTHRKKSSAKRKAPANARRRFTD